MADDFVLTCECGKHLKIPDDKEGKKIRCPGCKEVVVAKRPAPAPPRIIFEADLEAQEKEAERQQRALAKERERQERALAEEKERIERERQQLAEQQAKLDEERKEFAAQAEQRTDSSSTGRARRAAAAPGSSASTDPGASGSPSVAPVPPRQPSPAAASHPRAPAATATVVAQGPQSNGLGVAGFVLSLLGLFSCGILSPIGVILSLLGITKQPRGLAIAGLILGLVGMVCLVVLFANSYPWLALLSATTLLAGGIAYAAWPPISERIVRLRGRPCPSLQRRIYIAVPIALYGIILLALSHSQIRANWRAAEVRAEVASQIENANTALEQEQAGKALIICRLLDSKVNADEKIQLAAIRARAQSIANANRIKAANAKVRKLIAEGRDHVLRRDVDKAQSALKAAINMPMATEFGRATKLANEIVAARTKLAIGFFDAGELGKAREHAEQAIGVPSATETAEAEKMLAGIREARQAEADARVSTLMADAQRLIDAKKFDDAIRTLSTAMAVPHSTRNAEVTAKIRAAQQQKTAEKERAMTPPTATDKPSSRPVAAIFSDPPAVCAALSSLGLGTDEWGRAASEWHVTKGDADQYLCMTADHFPTSATQLSNTLYCDASSYGQGERIEKISLTASIYVPAKGEGVGRRFRHLVPILLKELGLAQPEGLAEAIRAERQFSKTTGYGEVTFRRDKFATGYGLTLTIRPGMTDASSRRPRLNYTVVATKMLNEARIISVTTEQLDRAKDIATELVDQYRSSYMVRVFFYQPGQTPGRDVPTIRYEWTKAKGLSTSYDTRVPTPPKRSDPALPKYEVLSRFKLMQNGRVYGDVLVPSLSRTTPADRREKLARAICKHERLDDIDLYSTKEAQKANLSASYAESHPDALREGFLGSLKDGTFLAGEVYP